MCVSYHECYQNKDQSAVQVGVSERFRMTVWIIDYFQNQLLLSTHTFRERFSSHAEGILQELLRQDSSALTTTVTSTGVSSEEVFL